MNFLIADTFTSSLARVATQEQKAAKTIAFDLQIDPSAPGMSFHKLDRTKDQTSGRSASAAISGSSPIARH